MGKTKTLIDLSKRLLEPRSTTDNPIILPARTPAVKKPEMGDKKTTAWGGLVLGNRPDYDSNIRSKTK